MAGNKNSGGNGKSAKRGYELTGSLRGAILNAMELADRESKSGKRLPMSEVLLEAFYANPLKFMDMAAKYIVKDVDKDIDSYKDASQLSNAELAEIVAQRARDMHEKSRIAQESKIDSPLQALSGSK